MEWLGLVLYSGASLMTKTSARRHHPLSLLLILIWKLMKTYQPMTLKRWMLIRTVVMMCISKLLLALYITKIVAMKVYYNSRCIVSTTSFNRNRGVAIAPASFQYDSYNKINPVVERGRTVGSYYWIIAKRAKP